MWEIKLSKELAKLIVYRKEIVVISSIASMQNVRRLYDTLSRSDKFAQRVITPEANLIVLFSVREENEERQLR